VEKSGPKVAALARLVSFWNGRLLATDGSVSFEKAAARGYLVISLNKEGWSEHGSQEIYGEDKILGRVSKRLQRDGNILLRGPDYKSLRWLLAAARGYLANEPAGAMFASTDWVWGETARASSVSRFEGYNALPEAPVAGLLQGQLSIHLAAQPDGDTCWFNRPFNQHRPEVLQGLLEKLQQGQQLKLAAPQRELLNELLTEVYALAAAVPRKVALSVALSAPISA